MMTSSSGAAAGAPTDVADHAAMRQAMVSSQLRTTGVDDARVIAAMTVVPREAFVPPASRMLAYRDTAIAVGGGRYLNSPLATARLLNAAEVLSGDRVLVIGAATGYAAAVLAYLGARVTAVENHPELLAIARTALAGIADVELVDAVPAEGHGAGGPYDLLFVDGAVEDLPAMLVDQLRVDGRVVSGIVDRGVTRLAAGRRSAGGCALTAFLDADCVVLPGFARPAAFRF